MAIRIILGVQVRMNKKSATLYLRNIIEDFKITDTGNNVFRQPAGDTDAFGDRVGNYFEQTANCS